MASHVRFAGYPSAFVFEAPNGKKKIQHLLWGDWLRLKPGDQGDFREMRARGVGGWMRKDSFTTERLLEATFVDVGHVGQGAGSFMRGQDPWPPATRQPWTLSYGSLGRRGSHLLEV